MLSHSSPGGRMPNDKLTRCRRRCRGCPPVYAAPGASPRCTHSLKPERLRLRSRSVGGACSTTPWRKRLGCSLGQSRISWQAGCVFPLLPCRPPPLLMRAPPRHSSQLTTLALRVFDCPQRNGSSSKPPHRPKKSRPHSVKYALASSSTKVRPDAFARSRAFANASLHERPSQAD